MRKLMTTTAVGFTLVLLGLPSHAQRLPPPPSSLPSSSSPLPSSSSIEVIPAGSSLYPGDIGDDVEVLQQALILRGINTGPVDGDYGPLTSDAVQIFQQRQGLPVTGIAGPATLDALDIDLGSNSATNSRRNRGTSRNNNRSYVAAVTEPARNLWEVQQVFGNAALDSARQGQFINIGSYSRRSEAADRVREARRSGFEARILYRR